MSRLRKRDDPQAITSTITTTTSTITTTTKSYTYTLPPLFTPLTSTATEADPLGSDTDFTVTLFSPLPSTTTTDSVTATIDDPDVQLPTLFAPLSSRVTSKMIFDEPTTTSSTDTSTPSSSSSDLPATSSHHSKLSGGAIAGIVIGSVVGVLFFIYMFYVVCWSRRKALQKARQEREEKKQQTTQNKRSTFISLDHWIVESDNEEDFDEKEKANDESYVYHDDNQPISLPRTQRYYDPNRLYSPTSSIKDPKDDFRSYYYSNPSYHSSNRSSVTGSVVSDGQQAPLLSTFQNNSTPFYGGFYPQYGPIMPQHTPAHLNNPNLSTTAPTAPPTQLYPAPFMMMSPMATTNPQPTSTTNPYFTFNAPTPNGPPPLPVNPMMNFSSESLLASNAYYQQHSSMMMYPDFFAMNQPRRPQSAASRSSHSRNASHSSSGRSTPLPIVYDEREEEEEDADDGNNSNRMHGHK
ncbi:MAG: hypothetical protein EXX96DRAFT_564841 [Benjaminiella poitrasii]|nr:MAG: hypothetical protein EXX96DRAFT_564841 [Benjaminiella poitrasii]